MRIIEFDCQKGLLTEEERLLNRIKQLEALLQGSELGGTNSNLIVGNSRLNLPSEKSKNKDSKKWVK